MATKKSDLVLGALRAENEALRAEVTRLQDRCKELHDELRHGSGLVENLSAAAERGDREMRRLKDEVEYYRNALEQERGDARRGAELHKARESALIRAFQALGKGLANID